MGDAKGPRKYGTHSFEIHLKQCKELYLAREMQKPPAERKKLPKDPRGFEDSDGTMRMKATTMTQEELDELNRLAEQSAMVPCEFCGRTFMPDKLPIHNRSCTKDNPAKSRKTAAMASEDSTRPVTSAASRSRPSLSATDGALGGGGGGDSRPKSAAMTLRGAGKGVGFAQTLGAKIGAAATNEYGGDAAGGGGGGGGVGPRVSFSNGSTPDKTGSNGKLGSALKKGSQQSDSLPNIGGAGDALSGKAGVGMLGARQALSSSDASAHSHGDQTGPGDVLRLTSRVDELEATVEVMQRTILQLTEELALIRNSNR
eukprot:gene10215-21293_t